MTHVFEESFAVYDLTRAVLSRLHIPYPYLTRIVEESNARLCFFVTALHSETQIRAAVTAVQQQLAALG